MTNEELIRIFNAGPNNGEDTMMQLYEQNMDLIWDIARKSAKAVNCLNSTSYSQNILDDLVSEGILAFSEVISSGKYDESLGKLTTYVYPFIKDAIHRWLEKIPDIFDQLGTLVQFILGPFYGIYGYEKMIKAEGAPPGADRRRSL